MLSISNMSQQQASHYYKEEQNYYQNKSETDLWQGKGAEALGLVGEIDIKQFERLCAGIHPTKDQTLVDTTKRAGTDLTFSAPKSVSVLVELADEKDSLALRKAHDEAVTKTLKFIESYAQTREQVNGFRSEINSVNFIAGKFQHDTSRSVDIKIDVQLHTHAFVINATQKENGEWRALHNDNLFKNRTLFGQIYRNELSLNVQKLGYEITVTNAKTGIWDIKNFNEELKNEFSSRTKQVEAKIKELKKEFPNMKEEKLNDKATLTSRSVKDKNIDRQQIKKDNIERAKKICDISTLADDLKTNKQVIKESKSIVHQEVQNKPTVEYAPVKQINKKQNYKSNTKISDEEIKQLRNQTTAELKATDPLPVLQQLGLEPKIERNGTQYNFRVRSEDKTKSAFMYLKDGEWRFNDFGGKNGSIENVVIEATGMSYKEALNYSLDNLNIKNYVSEKFDEIKNINSIDKTQELREEHIEKLETLKNINQVKLDKDNSLNSQIISTREIDKSDTQTIEFLKNRGISKIPKDFFIIEGQINGIGENGKPYTIKNTGVGVITGDMSKNIDINTQGADIHLLKSVTRKDGSALKTVSFGTKDFTLMPGTNKNAVAIFESKMDYAAAIQQINLDDRNVIIANGVGNHHKISQYINDNNIDKVTFFNQYDKAGSKFVDNIVEATNTNEFQYIKYSGNEIKKDINDLLQDKIELKSRLQKGTLNDFLISVGEQPKGIPTSVLGSKNNLEINIQNEATEKSIFIQNILNKATEILTDKESLFTKEQLLRESLKLSVANCTLDDFLNEIPKNNNLVNFEANIYSTKEMIKIEKEILANTKITIDSQESISNIKDTQSFLDKNFSTMTKGQKEAFNHILTNQDFTTAIQGDAGVGKTYLLKAVNDYINKLDTQYTLQGLSYTGKASDEIEKAASIKSSTLHSFLNQKEFKDNQIYLVDEASTIGSKLLHKLQKIADDTNSRIVLIGDTKQFQGIQAGGIFEQLQNAKAVKTVFMNESMRANTQIMKSLYQDIKDKNIKNAFNTLEKNKMIEESTDLTKVKDEYLKNKKDTLLVASKNEDRKALNTLIRQDLKKDLTNETNIKIRESINLDDVQKHYSIHYEKDQLVFFNKGVPGAKAGTETKITDINHDTNTLTLQDKDNKSIEVDLSKYGNKLSSFSEKNQDFAQNEKIIFTKNNKYLGVKNGQTATIQEIKDNKLSVLTESNKKITIDLNKYNYLDHGYAITDYKSQGQTAKNVIAVANSEMSNTNSFYVQVTRAKDNIKIFTDDIEKLKENTTMSQIKTSTLEYIKDLIKDETIEKTKELLNDTGTRKSIIELLGEYGKKLGEKLGNIKSDLGDIISRTESRGENFKGDLRKYGNEVGELIGKSDKLDVIERLTQGLDEEQSHTQSHKIRR